MEARSRDTPGRRDPTLLTTQDRKGCAMEEPMKLDVVYQRILEFAGQYNKTSTPNGELASMLWLEFVGGDYERVRAEFASDGGDDVPFMRAFVKTRCRRERTIETRRAMREIHGPVLEWLESSLPDPEEAAVRKDQKTRARAAIMKLTQIPDPRERRVAIMLMKGCTRREIQQELGCSLGTVQNLVQRLGQREPIKELYEILRG